MQYKGSSWTDQKVAIALQMAEEGASAAQIAAAIGDVSRNAVIGKLNRIGKPLSGVNGLRRAGTPRERAIAVRRPPSRPRSKFIPAFEPTPVEPTPELIALEVERGDGVHIVDLETHHCRWPHGNDGETWYCGRQRDGDSSYCEGHRYYACKNSENRATER